MPPLSLSQAQVRIHATDLHSSFADSFRFEPDIRHERLAHRYIRKPVSGSLRYKDKPPFSPHILLAYPTNIGLYSLNLPISSPAYEVHPIFAIPFSPGSIDVTSPRSQLSRRTFHHIAQPSPILPFFAVQHASRHLRYTLYSPSTFQSLDTLSSDSPRDIPRQSTSMH